MGAGGGNPSAPEVEILRRRNGAGPWSALTGWVRALDRTHGAARGISRVVARWIATNGATRVITDASPLWIPTSRCGPPLDIFGEPAFSRRQPFGAYAIGSWLGPPVCYSQPGHIFAEGATLEEARRHCSGHSELPHRR